MIVLIVSCWLGLGLIANFYLLIISLIADRMGRNYVIRNFLIEVVSIRFLQGLIILPILPLMLFIAWVADRFSDYWSKDMDN